MEPSELNRSLENGSIRLLTLIPSHPEEAIKCSLIYTTLDSIQTFEAISYAWGNSTDRVEIILNGKIFATTRSLHEALHQFRRKQEIRILWADAICINQDDPLERSRQIQIMSKIYLSAWRTLIWLGPVRPNIELPLPVSVPSDELAFKVLNMLSDFPRDEYFRLAPLDFRAFCIDWQDHIIRSSEFVEIEEDDIYNAMNNIASRGWFQRMWVLQELAVSKVPVLCCGSLRTPWWCLPHSQSVFHAWHGDWNGLKLDLLRHIFQADGTVHLSRIVYLCMDFHATDPKDKVLGFLSMVSRHYPVNPTMTVEQIYALAVLSCFSDPPTASSLFDVLAMVSERKGTGFRATLPSWTPDLSVSDGPRQFFTWVGDHNAGGYRCQFPAQESDWRSLRLRCIIIDGISALAALRYEQDVGSVPFVEATGLYPTGEPMSNVLWRLRICDCCTVTDSKAGVGREPRERPGSYYLDERVTSHLLCPLPHRVELRKSQGMYKNAKSPPSGGTLCQIDDHYLGWVPEDSQIGDKICIFEGGPAPFVLRERIDGYYGVVGDAYIHGIMRGEALNRPGIEWKEIELQ